MPLHIKCTGTTPGFEDYYGEVLNEKGQIVTWWYVKPRRCGNLYISRKGFKNYKSTSVQYDNRPCASSLPLFLNRVKEALECQSK